MADEIEGKPTHRGLGILLNVVGVLCVLGVLCAFLPASWLQASLDWFSRFAGLGEAETLGPIVLYGFRAYEVFLVGIAWMSFVAARDPEGHRDYLHAVMATIGAWVILCPVFGAWSGLPFRAYVGDTVEALVLLALLVALYPKRAPQVA